eukprot:g80170.t1
MVTTCDLRNVCASSSSMGLFGFRSCRTPCIPEAASVSAPTWDAGERRVSVCLCRSSTPPHTLEPSANRLLKVRLEQALVVERAGTHRTPDYFRYSRIKSIEAMPPKKKTTAEQAPAEPAPTTEPAPAEPAPTTEPASPDGKVTPASADGKAEAKSPLDGWGAKKTSKIKKTTEAPTRVYVVLKPDYKVSDEVWPEQKAGRVEAIYMITPGGDESPYVTIDKPSEGEEHVVRVFRSWASVKGYYIKGNCPFYVKEATIRGGLAQREK